MWTDEDRTIAIAWKLEQDLMCSGCGHPLDESMSDDAEGEYVAVRNRCHACKAIGLDEHDFHENDANKPQGMRWRAVRRGTTGGEVTDAR